ncbi:hypothetical protein [Staphylococcus epidermidis]|uniref:hypothetical protein n=1 Tax=Staphylococcus epidermidis TaxID=1282 RepID=UPI00119E502C|nr:hypothetical protein [Staphylococcus epidermidis]
MELFRDMGKKVKERNSYDLGFEEVEKEKEFLEVIVKEEDRELGSDENVGEVVEDLGCEIEKMGEEGEMLGEMIKEVDEEEEEVKELESDMRRKLDWNGECLK